MTQLLAQADAPYEMPYVLREEPEVIAIEENSESNNRGSANRSGAGGNSRTDSGMASESNWLTFEATAYTATCEGCIGITKTGIDVRNSTRHNGRHIIAVDPAVIPLGSVVQIRLADGSTIEAEAQDVGSAIQNFRIDILMDSKEEALRFGRQKVEVRRLGG